MIDDCLKGLDAIITNDCHGRADTHSERGRDREHTWKLRHVFWVSPTALLTPCQKRTISQRTNVNAVLGQTRLTVSLGSGLTRRDGAINRSHKQTVRQRHGFWTGRKS